MRTKRIASSLHSRLNFLLSITTVGFHPQHLNWVSEKAAKAEIELCCLDALSANSIVRQSKLPLLETIPSLFVQPVKGPLSDDAAAVGFASAVIAVRPCTFGRLSSGDGPRSNGNLRKCRTISPSPKTTHSTSPRC